MKRLLLPFLLLGLALLPSGIAAAGLGSTSQSAADVSELGVSVPTHGKHHWHGTTMHHHDGDDAEQEATDDDKQNSEQTNVIDGESLIGDVIPIAANIPVIPIQNVNIIAIQLINTALEVIPVNLCAAVDAVVGEGEDTECELAEGDSQEQSQLRNMNAESGNDTNTQSNEAEQEQEGEQEQEQAQLNTGSSHTSGAGSSTTQGDSLPATGDVSPVK